MFPIKFSNSLNPNILLALFLISPSQSLPVKQTNSTLASSGLGGSLARSLDESVNPCTDFYGYTCGHWTDHHTPEPGFPIWSNWYIISHELSPKIRRLLSDADSEIDNEAVRKARKVYRACMNKDKIEEAGAEPLKQVINENGGWPLMMGGQEWRSKNLTWQQIHSQLMKTVANEALFGIEIVADPKNSSITRLAVSEPDLILERKELVPPGKYSLLTAYNRYKIQVVHALQGSASPFEGEDYMAQLVDLNRFEGELAKITHDEQSIKDIDKWYSLMTIDQLQELFDSANVTSPIAKINWLDTIRDLFSLTPEIIVDGSEEVIVPGKEFFPKLAALLDKSFPETIVNYIMWKAITDLSHFANDELRDILTNFNNKRIGADPIATREYDCVSSSQMERAVSYAFVKKHFSPEWKQATVELVENIQEAMTKYIRQSPWLDDETKNLATEKINAIIKFIGYPDDYSGPDLDEYYSKFTPTDSYFENELRIRVFAMRNLMRHLRKPTDKNKWPINPNSVNAYYIPVLNTILVPAGILQPPLFDLNRPSVINYGMIGSTIGHEISHALDSNGRRFDKNGNAVTWWAQPAIDKYEEHVQCFINQFNNYTIFEDDTHSIPVNGTLTLEENISDSTGLQVTWDAYRIFRDKHAASGQRIPGLEQFTDDQIFFLAFGHLWCAYESDLYLQQYSPEDVHSPAKARVNGAVSNMAAFAAAFNCPVNTPVNPSKKCNIWL